MMLLVMPAMQIDETSKQLIIETRAPIPAKPGRKARHDYEYERNGVANLFMVFAPLEGWRLVKVTDRRTAIDYAHMLRDLSDVYFPDAAKIVLVQDNLNTHKPASLYEAFPAAESRTVRCRSPITHLPTHACLLRRRNWPRERTGAYVLDVDRPGPQANVTPSSRATSSSQSRPSQR